MIFLRMRELRESREAVNTSCERAAGVSRLVFVASREEEKARKISGTRVVGGGKDSRLDCCLSDECEASPNQSRVLWNGIGDM